MQSVYLPKYKLKPKGTHFLLKPIFKFIFSHSKAELFFLTLFLITTLVAFLSYYFLKDQRLQFYSQIRNIEQLSYEYKFDEAEENIDKIHPIFDYQRELVANKRKEVSANQMAHLLYLKAQTDLEKMDLNDAKVIFTSIPPQTMDYNKARANINDIEQIFTKEDKNQIQITQLLNTSQIEEKNNNLAKAFDDAQLAQKIIASDNYIINMNKALVNNVASQVTTLSSKIQEQKDLIQQEQSVQSQTKLKVYTIRIPILMYHYIRINPIPTDQVGFGLSVTPDDFDKQMNYLATNSYNSITMMDLVKALKNHSQLPDKSIIITFDDGYKDFYTNAYPILQKYNLKAETYVITNFVNQTNYMTWDMLKEISQNPLITIGSHTAHHPNLNTLSIDSIDNELTESKNTLEANLGITVTDFCYPFGDFNDLVAGEVQKAGYIDATTTVPGKIHSGNNFFRISRIRVSGGESIDTFASSIGK